MTNLDDALDTFVQASAERYASGEHAAHSDADTLREIARVLVEFVDDLAPLADKLDVARDQPQGGFVIRRSTWDRTRITMNLAAQIWDEMLSREAGNMLASLVAVELEQQL